MKTFATCGAIVALICSTTAQESSTSQAGSDVAARVGTRTITVEEIDGRWQQTEPADHVQAQLRIYEGRRKALDSIIAEMLIEQAAAVRGLEAAKLTDGEIGRRVQPVTDGQIVSFYQQNQAQMQGRTLDTMSAAIRGYLEEQQRAMAYRTFVDELRKAGPRIETMLDVPRYSVEVASDDPVLGSANALVTVVEFSDFQCPFCLRVVPTLKRLRETYGDQIRIVWKDFPLTAIHPQAFKAAEAGQCAREQGKFWEYHDRLFENPQALGLDFLKTYAGDVGLDAAAFTACLDTAKYAERVQRQLGIGTSLGISSTPSVFINGRLVSGAKPYETFAAVIEEELERARRRN